MRRSDIGSARIQADRRDRRPARRPARRAVQAGAAALAISLFGFASPASAHVTVTPSTTAAGAHAVLRFSVGHGCGNSPTTRITIQIPAQITSVTPTRTALWTIAKQTETVDPPAVDPHGNKIVQRTASVTFSAQTPLPDGYREVLELTVQLPESPGTKLAFPTIQTCEQGEAAWIEVAQDGRNVDDLELPAPSFTTSAPEDGMLHHTDTGGSHSGQAHQAAPVPGTDRALTFASLAVGLLGSLLGGTALVRQRRRA
ncbi:YcnI family protein [Catellatospora sp. KI3]|uniref:YcnI family copper-binding membrane protein n=1 Tax=Catellatospora sp. KI3 TaxID=3041620 RepID=UPI002482A0FF|nr:YcnI family protein [Catellatospora sp. KI3]MDI1460885.1 YcnI family protein [Catellatospora sp. KI3]